MSDSLTQLIGTNIRKLREEAKMSQNHLAREMHMARPGISNWENGKSEPSSSQLVRLSKVFGVCTDEIVGNPTDATTAVIVDTSALIKRPMIVEELPAFFKEVIIPEVVISELNALKGKENSPVQQRAWLVMKSIDDKGDRFNISPTIDHTRTNDEQIAAIAMQRAKSNPFDDVYVLSDDIWFAFLTKNQKNLQSLTPAEYAERFLCSPKDYNMGRTTKFQSLVKREKLNSVKQYDISDVDVNMASPEDGLTPLISAVRNRDIPMVEHLRFREGIDLDARDKHKYEFSAVHHATQLQRLDIIELLVEAGADCDLGSKGRNVGNTPLMVAAWGRYPEGVKYFISQGACANQQDSNGFTPLIKACIKHDLRSIELLAPLTDVNIRSRENKTAIQYVDPDKPNSDQIVTCLKEIAEQQDTYRKHQIEKLQQQTNCHTREGGRS